MNEDQDNLVSVFLGTGVTAKILKEYLLEIDIPSVLKNERSSSIDKTGDCEVFIAEHDVEKAKSLVEEFKIKNS
jgi:hypothetical protein